MRDRVPHLREELLLRHLGRPAGDGRVDAFGLDRVEEELFAVLVPAFFTNGAPTPSRVVCEN
jgi:hypothetical protein